MVLEKLDITYKKVNTDIDLTTVTKINTKCTTDPHVKQKTIKLLEDDIGENLDDLGYGDDFLDTTSKHKP